LPQGLCVKIPEVISYGWQLAALIEYLKTQRFVRHNASSPIRRYFGALKLNLDKTIWRLFAAVCMFVPAVPAFAALGADVSSVQADQAHISASLRVSPSNGYTVHELRSPTGAVVREFASSSGKVFAVAWQAPSLPDLRQLLGSYFDEFQKAAALSRRPGHAPLSVQHSGLAVQLGGHMRSFTGRAYLPDQLPSGVRMEDIQ
jgi:hypothetical protein